MIQRPQRRAFTIVELLVVIVIIGILASVGLYVGRQVAESGKVRATQNTLQVLDLVLAAYIDSPSRRGAQPPSEFIDGVGNNFPMFDGRDAGNTDLSVSTPPGLNPSLSIFLAQARLDSPEIDKLLNTIDPKYIEHVPQLSTLWGVPQLANGGGAVSGIVVKDGWGRPIRFVHPALDGGYGAGFRKDTNSTSAGAYVSVGGRANFGIARLPNIAARRSAWPIDPNAKGPNDLGDADEGRCPAKHAYFYSVGPDGDAGTRDDNVYSNKKPDFGAETRQGNSAN